MLNQAFLIELDWNEERKEENRMGKINIEGLTEEEMISYTKLVSIEAKIMVLTLLITNVQMIQI